jgi:RNA polymerase sigma factor (sigma-70 family)
MMDERELLDQFVRQLLDGEREIVAATLAVINRYMHRFGGYRLRDPENVKYDALSALLQNLRQAKFKGENIRQFNAYLRSIVQNTVLRARELEARYETVPDPSLLETPDAEGVDQFANKDLVRYVLNRLHPNCQELLTLKYLEDLDNSEIAERLKIREGTLRQRLSRCTEGARQILRDNGLL